MTTGPMNRVLSHLHRFALLSEHGGLSDAQLVERFLTRREEIVFEALVRRHGPMVLSVCRRVLANPHDADDAFQATFLVLARKASSIRPRGQVGPWLYGVARRTALKARAASARRRRAERAAGRQRPCTTPAVDGASDLRPLLDEELGHLPEVYRAPLVLCLLEGKSRKTAAGLLGWTEGTLSGRLARAKHLLGARLRRRGVAPAAGGLTAALAGEASGSQVPAALATATAKAAVWAAEPAAALLSTPVVALTQEVLKTMLLSKVKVAVGVAVLVAGIGLGAAVAWPRGPVGTQAAATPTGVTGKDVVTQDNKKEERSREYVIEPPDVLVVEYARIESNDPVKLTGSRLVRPDGTIGLGLLGSVMVAGLAVEEARGAVARYLAGRLDGFDPAKLHLDVQAYNSKVYYVIVQGSDGLDQVYRFPATGSPTVLDALVQVRVTLIGLGKKRVFVHRRADDGKGGHIMPVDWKAITLDGYTATNYPLRPGDRVRVENIAAKTGGALRQAGPPGDAADTGRLPRPSEGEVIRTLPKAWANGHDLQITFELLSHKLEEPRMFPLIGSAQLAHAHWKCVVYSSLGVEVRYFDREALIPYK
jgi:RNA polymerase sigma factor (sigma-70 family)